MKWRVILKKLFFLNKVGLWGMVGLVISIISIPKNTGYGNISQILTNSNSQIIATPDATTAGNFSPIISGNGNTVIMPEVKGDSIERIPSFHSTFNDDQWTVGDGLTMTGTTISYKGTGQPVFMCTKEVFPQHGEIRLHYIAYSDATNLITRIENAFDYRHGDGGNTESSLGPFTDENTNWPSINLQNPNLLRKSRWKLPCPIPKGQEVGIRITVDAPTDYEHSKTVSVYLDYYCANKIHIDPQAESYKPPIWKFEVPKRVNRPSHYCIGLNDPDGLLDPEVKLIDFTIYN